MVELAKEAIGDTVQYWEKKFVKEQRLFDLIENISTMQVKIMLRCAFGEDISNIRLPYFKKGVES